MPSERYPVYDQNGQLIGVRQGRVIAYYNGALKGTPYSNLYVSKNGYNLYYDPAGGVSATPGVNPLTGKPYTNTVHVYSVEQAFTFGKALAFQQRASEAMKTAQERNDQQAFEFAKHAQETNSKIMEEVLKANPGDGHVMHQLGHQVAGYNEFGGDEFVNQSTVSWMSEAMMAKGCSDPVAHDALVKSMGYDLVEASPRDGKWGAKLDLRTSPDLEHYTGSNIQGALLSNVRNKLLSDELYRQHVKEEFNKRLAQNESRFNSEDAYHQATQESFVSNDYSQASVEASQPKSQIYYAAVSQGKGAVFESPNDLAVATQNMDHVEVHRFKTKQYADTWASLPTASLRKQYLDTLYQLTQGSQVQSSNTASSTYSGQDLNMGDNHQDVSQQETSAQASNSTNVRDANNQSDYGASQSFNMETNSAISMGQTQENSQQPVFDSSASSYSANNGQQYYETSSSSVESGNYARSEQEQSQEEFATSSIDSSQQNGYGPDSQNIMTDQSRSNYGQQQNPYQAPYSNGNVQHQTHDQSSKAIQTQNEGRPVYPKGEIERTAVPSSTYTLSGFGHDPRQTWNMLTAADNAMGNTGNDQLRKTETFSQAYAGNIPRDRYSVAEQMKFEALIKNRIAEHGNIEVQCGFEPGAEMAFTRAAIAVKKDKKFANKLTVVGNFAGPEEFADRDSLVYKAEPDRDTGYTFAQSSAEEAKLMLNDMDKVNRYHVSTSENGKVNVQVEQWNRTQTRQYLSGSPSGFDTDFAKGQQDYATKQEQNRHASAIPKAAVWKMRHDMVDRSHEVAAVYCGQPLKFDNRGNMMEGIKSDTAKLISYAQIPQDSFDPKNIPDPDRSNNMFLSQRNVSYQTRDSDGQVVTQQTPLKITRMDPTTVADLALHPQAASVWKPQIVDGQQVSPTLATDPVPQGKGHFEYPHYRTTLLNNFKTPYSKNKFINHKQQATNNQSAGNSFNMNGNQNPQATNNQSAGNSFNMNGNQNPQATNNQSAGNSFNMNGNQNPQTTNNQLAGSSYNDPSLPPEPPVDDNFVPSDQDYAELDNVQLNTSAKVTPSQYPGDHQVEQAMKTVKDSGKVNTGAKQKALQRQGEQQKRINQQQRTQQAGVTQSTSLPKTAQDDISFEA